jgi:hypothetical protein
MRDYRCNFHSCTQPAAPGHECWNLCAQHLDQLIAILDYGSERQLRQFQAGYRGLIPEATQPESQPAQVQSTEDTES